MIFILPGHFIIKDMSDIKKRNQLITMFVDRGYTQNQAIGIVANLQAESGFRTRAHGDRGLVKGGSHGLAQWNKDRLSRLQNMYGDGWDKLENQVDYIDWELKNTETDAGEALRKATTIEEATRVMTTKYERPANKHQKANERIGIALSYKDIIPESYVYEASPEKVSEFKIKSQTVGIAPKGGSVQEAPDLTEEQKTDFAKLDIIQSQLATLLQQQQSQPIASQQEMPTQQVAQQEDQPTYGYLTNQNLFTIQDENI